MPAGLPKPNCIEKTWYYYDLNIVETTGLAPVTLSNRTTTWLNGDVEPTISDAAARFGTATVPAGGTITAYNRWFCSDYHPENRTELWLGRTNATGCPVVSTRFSNFVA